jgi:urease accessory protein
MAMRAILVKMASTWSGIPADSVVLDYDGRQRRRISMRGKKGLSFLLDLPHRAHLRGGDALVLEDGRLIQVVAASEPLIEIHCASALQTARIAWHLGNRHVPTQLWGTALRIRRDHVIADMAKQLGADVIEIEAPFDPEGGAYPHQHRDHGHDG